MTTSPKLSCRLPNPPVFPQFVPITFCREVSIQAQSPFPRLCKTSKQRSIESRSWKCRQWSSCSLPLTFINRGDGNNSLTTNSIVSLPSPHQNTAVTPPASKRKSDCLIPVVDLQRLASHRGCMPDFGRLDLLAARKPIQRQSPLECDGVPWSAIRSGGTDRPLVEDISSAGGCSRNNLRSHVIIADLLQNRLNVAGSTKRR